MTDQEEETIRTVCDDMITLIREMLGSEPAAMVDFVPWANDVIRAYEETRQE
jgi:hypothetical protein